MKAIDLRVIMDDILIIEMETRFSPDIREFAFSRDICDNVINNISLIHYYI